MTTMKSWNIGNTSVRNPERIRAGLAVFAEDFAGGPWDQKVEEAFFNALVERGVYAPTGDVVAQTTAGQGGRKWASAFKQLGFATVGRRGGTALTPVGESLLDPAADVSAVFLRQLLKQHLPSPIDRAGRDFDVCPLRMTLKVMDRLRTLGLGGPTKEEIGLFLVTTTRGGNEAEVVDRIADYRTQRDALKGGVAKARFYGSTRLRVAGDLYAGELTEKVEGLNTLVAAVQADPDYLDSAEADVLLATVVRSGKGSATAKAVRLKNRLRKSIAEGEPVDSLVELVTETHLGTRATTLFNYADTTARYFSMTGLFAIAGSRLVLKETMLPLSLALAAEEYPAYDEASYLAEFYDPHSPRLPSDDEAFLTELVSSLQVTKHELESALSLPESQDAHLGEEPDRLRGQMNLLREELADLKEQEFYRRQASSVTEIDDFFDEIENRTLFGGVAYLPAFYEWNVWRVFLAVNQIVNAIPETRGFALDEDMYPVHHAKAGQPDMLFAYDDCLLVVEVSLSMGENQWSQEQEPVPRHVKDVILSNPGRDVMGLFVAPKIDPNTAVTFRNYPLLVDGRERRLDIVPLSTEQLRTLLRWFDSQRFGSSQVLATLRELLAYRDAAGDGLAWLRQIESHIEGIRVGYSLA